jgi:hypothetical protein
LLEEGVIESPIAEGDKLQELRDALAGNLSEPPLISTITEPSPPTFLDEEPAEQTPVGTERALVDETEQTDAAIAGTPAEQAPVDAPADAGNLAIPAERAKSVLGFTSPAISTESNRVGGWSVRLAAIWK